MCARTRMQTYPVRGFGLGFRVCYLRAHTHVHTMHTIRSHTSILTVFAHSMRARTCLCLVSVPTRMHTYPVRGEPERRISSAPVLEEVEKQVDGPQDHKKHLRVLAITV